MCCEGQVQGLGVWMLGIGGDDTQLAQHDLNDRHLGVGAGVGEGWSCGRGLREDQRGIGGQGSARGEGELVRGWSGRGGCKAMRAAQSACAVRCRCRVST